MDVNGLNVFPVGDMTAAHSLNRYDVAGLDTTTNTFRLDLEGQQVLSILFQDGNPATVGRNGVTLEALLEVARHRIDTFQTGPHACPENAAVSKLLAQSLDILYSRGQRVQQSNAQPVATGMIQVWMEGFQATGESSKAQLMGTVKAETFSEACQKLSYERTELDWNEQRTKIWGCRLFDNEADARRAYG